MFYIANEHLKRHFKKHAKKFGIESGLVHSIKVRKSFVYVQLGRQINKLIIVAI